MKRLLIFLFLLPTPIFAVEFSIDVNPRLSDSDIRHCVVTKQWSVLVVFSKQSYEYNLWCMANELDCKGIHDGAARLRCSIPKVRKVYASHKSCVTALTAKERK